jgi:type IV pilus assembly protein PilV
MKIQRAGTQRGVGLIEVMVAVLVVSVGFLGIAALQAMSLQVNSSASARSMATIASYSILDAMRADGASARSGSYDGTVTANACPDATGSLAKAQLRAWCQQLGASLGAVASTTGKVACNNSGECTITITYDDSRSKIGSNAQSIATKAIL